ncbi:MAG: nuclear transport factor 2 family protein [Pyrinomonadaceae bacterium]
MKKLFIAIALMTLFGSFAYGQKKMTDEQTIMKMEQEMTDGVIKGDVSANDKYAADSAVFTDPGGMMMNKAQSMAMFKSGDLKIESSKIDGMKVQMFGDTAIATYTTMDKGMYKGRDISGQYRWTDVFVKMGGKWKLVAGQGTPIVQQ